MSIYLNTVNKVSCRTNHGSSKSRINSNNYSISIYQVSVVIVNLEAKILASFVSHLKEAAYPPQTMGDNITQAIQACMWQANFSREQISGVGSGTMKIMPGVQACWCCRKFINRRQTGLYPLYNS